MKRITIGFALCAVFCVLLCSCGKDGPPRKDTYPVTGEVYVDGQAAGQLAVRCISVTGLDKEDPTISSAFTDDEGKFEISTYESADGVPPSSRISMQYQRPDSSTGGSLSPGRCCGLEQKESLYMQGKWSPQQEPSGSTQSW